MTIDEWIEKYYSPYNNAYAEQLAAAQQRLAEVTDAYDYASDPLYIAYAAQFGREGRNAALNAYGEAASGVGGMPSSYAYAAAQQAKSYYDAKLADKIPELWELAYDARLDELNFLKGEEKTAYERWLDGVEAGYKLWQDEYERAIEEANLEIKRRNAAVAEANAALRQAQAAARTTSASSAGVSSATPAAAPAAPAAAPAAPAPAANTSTGTTTTQNGVKYAAQSNKKGGRSSSRQMRI